MTRQERSRVWAAFLLLLLGGLQACSGLPRIVLLRDPLTPQEHVKLGTSYQEQGLRELAAKEFQAALGQQREYAPALVGLGNLSFEAGSLKEAEEYYRQALAVAPDDPSATNNLAMVYLSRGERLEEAELLARKALEQGGPLRPYVLDTLAGIYVRQGRYREAKAALDDAEALAPLENNILRERLAALRRELAARDSPTK